MKTFIVPKDDVKYLKESTILDIFNAIKIYLDDDELESYKQLLLCVSGNYKRFHFLTSEVAPFGISLYYQPSRIISKSSSRDWLQNCAGFEFDYCEMEPSGYQVIDISLKKVRREKLEVINESWG